MKQQRCGFQIEPTATAGAVVTDLDLSGEIAGPVAADLMDAWLEHGLLIFPKAGKTSGMHLRLSRVFGELQEHVIPSLRLKDEPELIAMGTSPETRGPPAVVDGELRVGFLYLHQDASYTPAIGKGSVLRMIQTPERGGDTIWVDLEKAYNGLPDDLKAQCEANETVQRYAEFSDPLWGTPDMEVRAATSDEAELKAIERPDFPLVVQPMVIRHPTTGRKSLLMTPAGFLSVYGMDPAEGEAFYDRIARHTTRPEFTYRHSWSEGDMILWDNRRTMHWALGYPFAMKRIVQRTTLRGDMLTGRYLDPQTQSDIALAM